MNHFLKLAKALEKGQGVVLAEGQNGEIVFVDSDDHHLDMDVLASNMCVDEKKKVIKIINGKPEYLDPEL